MAKVKGFQRGRERQAVYGSELGAAQGQGSEICQLREEVVGDVGDWVALEVKMVER